MATAGVMLLKGPQARRYTQKAAHTQGSAQKAEHTKGGLWPPQESCYLYTGGGLLVYGGIPTRGGDGLNQTFGRPKVRPDFRPFFRPKQGGGR